MMGDEKVRRELEELFKKVEHIALGEERGAGYR
jgi:hypothetical protein